MSAGGAALPGVQSDYLIDVWQSDDGLPQNSVIAMAQTTDGYLWVSTFDGLARFDGKRFEVFQGDNIPAISGDIFITLAADASGNLWLRGGPSGATALGQTRVVLWHRGLFRELTARDGLPPGGATALVADPKGAIWIGDRQGQLLTWKDGRFVSKEARAPTDDWGAIFNLAFDGDGGVWVWQDSRVARLADGRWSIVYRNQDGARVGPIRPLRDGSMALIAGAEHNVMYRWAAERLSKWDTLPRSYAGYVFAEDPDGDLWISTATGILRRAANGDWSELTPNRGLPADSARSEFVDREGNRWFGTDGGGLTRLKRRAVRAFGEGEGMSKRVALSVALDNANSAWVAVLGGGLNHFDGGRFEQATVPRWLEPAQLAWSVRPGHDGDIWIGTYTDGLLDYRPDSGTLRHFDFQSSPGMIRGPVQALLETTSGDLWVGGELGLARYSSGKFQSFPLTNVTCIAEDKSGAIWVGGKMGLTRLGVAAKTFTEADGLAGNLVNALCCDSWSNLWIGGRDLTRFNGARFTALRDLPVKTIKGMVEDDLGNLWCGTAHGILRASIRQLNAFCDTGKGPVEFALFTKADGLASDECSGSEPSVWKGPDGRIWFATLNGLAVIDPRHLPKNNVPPPVVIESVVADGKAIPLSGELRIPAGTLRLEFHFAALSFTAPDKNRFRYRLEGFEPDWSDEGAGETAAYTRLPPGSYQFHVRACNNDGVWNESGAILPVKMMPFFWQTNWFHAFVALMGAGLIVAIFRIRLAQVERRRLTQESFTRQVIETQEIERHRIAQELHDGVGQILLLVKNHLLLGSKDIKGPTEHLETAAAMTTQAIEEVRATSRALRPAELDCLGLGKALEAMIGRIAATSNTRFSFELDDIGDSLGREIEIQLYRIAQEAINNIVKHAQAANVIVELKSEAESVRLTVQDDGVGFDPEISGRQGAFGLPGMAERARLIGGQFMVMSLPGKGCRLTVSVPLVKQRHE